MTRILIASLNYAPEETGIAPYSTKLAEHLAVQGYAVDVVTGMPHYPAWRVDAAYATATRGIESINGVTVHRRAHYVPASQSALRRARYEATSLMMAIDALRGPRPDAVIGVMPSLSGGIAARAAAARFRVPYGIILQDLMGQAAGQSGITGAGRAARLIAQVEGFALRGAAAAGIIAEGFRPYVESLGVEPARIRRVRNWTHVAPPASLARRCGSDWTGPMMPSSACTRATWGTSRDSRTSSPARASPRRPARRSSSRSAVMATSARCWSGRRSGSRCRTCASCRCSRLTPSPACSPLPTS